MQQTTAAVRMLFLESAACKLAKEKNFIIEKKVQSRRKPRLEQPFPHNIFEGAQSSS